MDKNIIRRSELKEICSFILYRDQTFFQSQDSTEPDSSDKTLHKARSLVLDALKIPYDKKLSYSDAEDALEDALDLFEQVCMEIGMKFGAKILFDLLYTDEASAKNRREIMQKEISCCFTGHRKLPKNMIQGIEIRLSHEIDKLIEQNITVFISGGALGFDQLVARLILSKKEINPDIRLVFALPCIDQDKRWSINQKTIYRDLLSKADEVIYVSEEYTDDCMKKRNQYMVDRSSYCICALWGLRSGTAQTVNYAKLQNLHVVNVIE